MAAMVMGSMVPDLPMFGLVPWSYSLSHSLAGIVTVDLLAGIATTGLWLLLLADLAADAAPRRLRGPRRDAYGVREWALSVPATVLGSATHVGWDEFTHAGRWGARHVAWLAESHAGLAGFKWGQYGSSVVGGFIVLISAWRYLRGRRSTHLPPHHPALARGSLLLAAVATVATSLWVAAAHWDDGVHAAAYATVMQAVPVAFAGVVGAALVWRSRVISASRAQARGGSAPTR
jgi:hypothetical protein